MRTFSIFLLFIGCLGGSLSTGLFFTPANAQTTSQPDRFQAHDSRVEIANLRADIQVLDRRMREMALAMEDLRLENRRLNAELERTKGRLNQPVDSVSHEQLERAINNLRQQMQAANSEQGRRILNDVTRQIEALGKQTQNALDTMARNVSSRSSSPPTPANPPSFSDDFPKEGISYTVKSGDTLSGIAARHKSTVRDIQNANRIADPGSIQVGQTLFIPQRSN